MTNFEIFSPYLILCVSGLGVLLLEAFKKKETQLYSGYLAVFAQALALTKVWRQILLLRTGDVLTAGPRAFLFENAIQIDSFGLFVCAIILLTSLITTIGAMDYLERKGINYGEYHAFQLFAVLGMMLLVVSMDLVTLFISLELMSLPIYVMCGYRRDQAEGIESSLKYFILGGFAAAVLMFGIAHIYGQTQSANLAQVAEALRTGKAGGVAIGNMALLNLGVGLFAAGLLFKIAAVPLHFWLPDVYEGAPAPATGFMAAGVKAAAFAVLIKFLYIGYTGDPSNTNPADPLLHAPFDQLVVIVACLTMLVPNLIALRQDSVKRLLAYSSIAHAGYMLVGVRAMSSARDMAGDPAVAALLYYLMAYGIMTAGSFIIVGRLTGDEKESGSLDALNGLGYKKPFLSAVLAICVLSMAGAPPLAGFWGKYLVFKSAVDQGFVGLAVFAVLASVIAVYYYLRILVHLYMRPAVEGLVTEDSDREVTALKGWDFNIALGGVAFALLWLGVGPFSLFNVIPDCARFWNWSQFAAQSLVGF
jgi:NADH-quinone oxidoreductase subunit N